MEKYSDKYNKAKKMFLNGKSLTKISKELKMNRNILSKKLKEEGVEITINNRKYEYNETIFEKIDTEEKAYWLGFLYADGYVNYTNGYSLELALAEKDKDHLKKFIDFILNKPNYNIIKKREVSLNGKVFESNRVIIKNKKIVNDLKNLKCIQKKSLILEFPNNDIVPKKLISDFIRGYFDGDGSVKEKGISICGTKNFLNRTMECLLEISEGKISKTKLYKDKRSNVWSYSKGGKNQLIILFELIFKNKKIYLDRKYKKLDAVCSRK